MVKFFELMIYRERERERERETGEGVKNMRTFYCLRLSVRIESSN